MESLSESETSDISEEPVSELKYLRLQVKLLNELLMESRSKNEVLMENNRLLLEKIQGETGSRQKITAKKSKHNSDNVGNEAENNGGNFNKVSDVASTAHLNYWVNEVSVASQTSREMSEASVITQSQRKQNDKRTQNEEQQWIEVKKKQTKKQKPSILGTGQVDVNVKIHGAVKKKWLYVGRIAGTEVTEIDLKEFISASIKEESVMVKKLPTKGSNSSFSVGTQNDEVHQKLQNPAFWPAGVVIREFYFRNFFQRDINVNKPNQLSTALQGKDRV